MSSSKAALAAAALLAGFSFGGAPTRALAAHDLSDIRVAPQRGQSADRARRDRYECHNWAIEQTGVVPRRPPAEPVAEKQAKRERSEQTLNGALVGAGIGGFLRALQGRDPLDGILVGAAAGAVTGTITANRRQAKERAQDDPVFDDYFRALSACLEARGYEVTLPGESSGA